MALSIEKPAVPGALVCWPSPDCVPWPPTPCPRGTGGVPVPAAPGSSPKPPGPAACPELPRAPLGPWGRSGMLGLAVPSGDRGDSGREPPPPAQGARQPRVGLGTNTARRGAELQLIQQHLRRAPGATLPWAGTSQPGRAAPAPWGTHGSSSSSPPPPQGVSCFYPV